MATPGLSFADPLLGKVGVGEEPNPYVPFSPTSNIGLGGLGPSAADLAITGQELVSQSQFTMPEMKQPPAIAFSPSRREFFVQGTVFGEGDAVSALEAEKLLSGPSTGLPTGGDWVPLDQQAYGQFLQSIRQPSRGRLFSKGFEAGGQQLKQLYGGALQALGAEETGTELVMGAERRLRQLAPFQRDFTDVDVGSADRGLIDWFVANLGQQGPMLLESIATGLAGAALGTAAAGPGLGTAGGAIAGFFGKKAYKDKVIEAAARYRAGQVAKDSAEFALLKNASALAGGLIGSGAGEYIIGVGDVYNELREQGANPDDAAARLTAAAAGLPYAALSILPEALIVGRILGVGGRAALPAGTSLRRRGGELLRRGVTGAAVYGGIEGVTEVGQEALTMGVSGQDLTSPEAINRFINSFAAGAAVSGVLGGAANLRSRKPDGTPAPPAKAPVNLLETPTKPIPTSAQMELPLEGGMVSVGPSEFRPEFMPTGMGQGVLDIGVPGQPLTELEMLARQEGLGAVRPTPELYGEQLDLFAPPTGTVGPNVMQQPGQQMPFQFAPPAPETTPLNLPPPTTPFGQQLLSAQRQQEFQLAQQQLEAQRQADLDRLANVGQGQRQLDFAAQQAQPTTPPQQFPMRQVPPPTPQQLPLFTPQQAPRPSRGEALRRGIPYAGLPEMTGPAVEPRVDLRRSTQIPLFTQAGEPSLAALRSVAQRVPITPVPEKGGRQRKPTGFRGKPLTAFQREAAEAYDALREPDQPSFAQLTPEQREVWYAEYKKFKDEQEAAAKAQAEAERKAKEEADAIQKRSTKKVSPRKPPEAGKGVGGKVRRAKEPTGKGEALKKGEAKKQKPPVSTVDEDAAKLAIAKAQENFDPGSPLPLDKAIATNRRALVDELKQKGETDQKIIDNALKIYDAEVDRILNFMLEQQAKTRKAELTNKRRLGLLTVDRSYGEQVLKQYDALTDAQKDAVAQKLGLTRAQFIETEAVFERTEEVDEAIAAVKRDTKKKSEETKATKVEKKEPPPPPPPTPSTSRELFDSTIETLETTKDPYQYRMAMLVLFDYAYFPDSNDTKAGITAQAVEFANDLPKDSTFRNALVTTLQNETSIDAKKDAALFQAIVDSKLLSDMMSSMEIKNLPDEFKVGGIDGDPVSQPKKVDDDLRNPGSVLAEFIRELNTRTSMMPAEQQARNIEKLAEMYKAAKAAGLDDYETQNGKPLSSYFDANGKPLTYVVSKKLRVGTKPVTKEQARALEDAGADIDDDYEAPFTLDDWNVRNLDEGDGRYFRDDGREITAPVGVGKIRLVIAGFLRKLQIKPRVSVFKNQADLKARDPELYRRAKAARTEGDFDTSSAVGYSFGDGNVIIFSDRVATEQQLQFVLAHETLGHFGFRSIIPAQKFDALMEQIYNLSPAIRNGVNAAMAARKQSKAEATEEYLADFAAQLDVSIVARIWNAIKGALNKLNIQFGDEAARYFVSQARRYVRNGDMSAMFDAKQVVNRLVAFESGQDPNNTGRFAQPTNLRGDNIAAGLMMNNIGGVPANFDEASKWLKDLGIDSSNKAEKFLTNFFSLLNYRARENPGFSAIHDVISAGRDLSMQIKVTMQEKLAPVLNKAVKFGVGNLSLGEVGGINEKQTSDLDALLYAGQRYAVSKLTDFRTLGKEPLFKVDDTGTLVPNQTEIDRVYNMGLITFEQAKKGFEYDVVDFDDEGKQIVKKDKFAGYADLTEDDIRWKGYALSREAMRDVELKLLQARYLSYMQDRDLAFREIADITTDKKLSPEENRNLDRLYKKYREIYTDNKIINEAGDPSLNPESIEKANDFIVAVNAAILGKASDRNAAVAAYFQGKTADDVVAFIEAFKKRLILPEDEKSRFAIQNRMKDIIIAEIGNDDADLYTKRTLATGYTPLLRQGEWEIKVVAYDKQGNRVRLKADYKDQLVYSQLENESEALAMAGAINDGLFTDNGKEKFYKVEAYNENTMTYELMDVRLAAEPSAALDAIAAPPELNLNEFTRGLRQFNIVLNPTKMEQVIVALTRQNARARQRLRRAFVPGADTRATIAITQHVESRASTIAKVTMRPKLNELMNLSMSQTQKLWQGDKKLLDTLKKNWETIQKDPNANEEQKAIAKREYEKYAYMYNKTNPATGAKRGNMYYNEAARQLAFLDNNKAIEESDFATGKVASAVRSYTSIAQLGASFATGALNYIGAITNGIPYLATYNSKTAFGGGFGFGNSMSEFSLALHQVGLRKALITKGGMNTAEFFDNVATSPQLLKWYGLEKHEAQFLAREIREGVMIPAQSNALTATARGRATTGAGQKTMDTMMWTFNSTEQASRRALGLAAYRLAYRRAKAAGLSDKDAAISSRDFAVEGLRFTVGEYSVVNRPPAWKSGVQSFLYMYKVFPTTSIQLLARLPKDGQVAMLTALFILGGISSFPFAEDMEDIVDTLAQALGWKQGSIRGEIAKRVDQIVPGASPYVLSGFANSIFAGDLAVRTSLGDFIPGTGFFLAGANTTRELQEVGGPAISFLTGTANAMVTAVKAAASEKVTLNDFFRESPVTTARAFGDAYAYTQAGAIIDKRGYIVTEDLHAGTILTRLLGFYPEAASSQYNQIRVAKRVADYQREVSAGFQRAWIKAKIMGNEDQADAVANAVDEWNEGAKGTALEIRNFTRNANRALREAERPAMERFLRTAPLATREELDTTTRLLGYGD